MTTDELNEAFRKYEEAYAYLENILSEAAPKLGYTRAESIQVREDYVHVRMRWYGSYQATDYEDFIIPLAWVHDGVNAVAQNLKAQIDAKAEQQREYDNRVQRETDLRKLQELKDKYEPKQWDGVDG